MTKYEYKVVPAPAKGLKVKGAKTTEARFAHALMTVMNEMGQDGWEYQRTDTLPCEERVGLTGRTTRFQNMLVFRRAIVEAPTEDQPLGALPAPEHVEELRESLPIPADEASAAARVADTLSAEDPTDGKAPRLRAVPDAGPAPRLGAALGNGLSRSDA